MGRRRRPLCWVTFLRETTRALEIVDAGHATAELFARHGLQVSARPGRTELRTAWSAYVQALRLQALSVERVDQVRLRLFELVRRAERAQLATTHGCPGAIKYVWISSTKRLAGLGSTPFLRLKTVKLRVSLSPGTSSG